MSISLVIPTIGRIETLPAVLSAAILQRSEECFRISELIVLDESRSPVCGNYAVNQCLDLASITGVDNVVVIRERNRMGIGAARKRLVDVATNDIILMVDDDVVLGPDCMLSLASKLELGKHWVVPTCVLVPADLVQDGYTDKPVSIKSVEVKRWVERYPWFIPYFRYLEKDLICEIPCSGTQAIMFERDRFLSRCQDLDKLGNLPREDTYLTMKMGPGLFVGNAMCYHLEHRGQIDRGNWESSMFYRIHEAILKDPDMFIEFMGDTKVEGGR